MGIDGVSGVLQVLPHPSLYAQCHVVPRASKDAVMDSSPFYISI